VVRLSAPAEKGVDAMKRFHTHWLRVIHKWIGLIIGVQFLLWALSGTIMALLPMDEVEGGARTDVVPARVPEVDQWPAVRQQLGNAAVVGVSLRPLLNRQVFEISTPNGIQVFDAISGRRVIIDSKVARDVAVSAYGRNGRVKGVSSLGEVTLPVRDHELPIWRGKQQFLRLGLHWRAARAAQRHLAPLGLLLDAPHHGLRAANELQSSPNMDVRGRSSVARDHRRLVALQNRLAF
jgi:hypothetical protein